MSKPRFSVRFPKTSAPAVYYDITISKNVRLRGKTNSVLHPDTMWSKKHRIAIGDKTEAAEINIELDNFEKFVVKQLWDLKKESNIKERLKDKIEVYFQRIDTFEETEELTLKEFIVKFIEEKKNEVGEQAVSSGTIAQYENWQKILLAFEKNKFTLSFDAINKTFYAEYVTYLKDVKGFSPNTIGKNIKNLKTIMTASHIEGHHNNLKYKGFKKPTETKKDVVFLNKQQLKDLSELKLTGKKAAVRDYFLLMGYTGMRVQDMLRLTKENIVEVDGERMISFTVGKTKEELAFIITDEMEAVFERNEGGFPKMKILSPYINRTIKDLTANRKVHCHTARRSYCTNAFLDGIPVPEIMFQSGHKKESTFYNYIKSTGRETVAAMSKRRKAGL